MLYGQLRGQQGKHSRGCNQVPEWTYWDTDDWRRQIAVLLGRVWTAATRMDREFSSNPHYVSSLRQFPSSTNLSPPFLIRHHYSWIDSFYVWRIERQRERLAFHITMPSYRVVRRYQDSIWITALLRRKQVAFDGTGQQKQKEQQQQWKLIGKERDQFDAVDCIHGSLFHRRRRRSNKDNNQKTADGRRQRQSSDIIITKEDGLTSFWG